MKRAVGYLSIILILTIIFCFPVSASEYAEYDDSNPYLKANGQLGDDVFYAFDKSTGVVKIYGNGPMWDFKDDSPEVFSPYSCTPFYNCSSVKEVIIEYGVTTIGVNTFLGCNNLSQISVAKSIEEVGKSAFQSESIVAVYFYGDAPKCVGYSYKSTNDIDRNSNCLGWQSMCIYHLSDRTGWDDFTYMVYTNYRGDKIPGDVKTFCGAPYQDITGESWCADSVCIMWDEGIMKGTELGFFSPNDCVTRGMLATILYRMANVSDAYSKSGCEYFPDIKTGSYCDEAIGWAYENSIILGYEDGTFKPNQSITRQEVATMLYRYSNAKSIDLEPINKIDAKTAADWQQVGGFAKDAMIWAVAGGIINGTDSTRLVLCPNDTATRAQMAVIIARYISV